MTFRNCLLAEYVEKRLDTYETRPCSFTTDYAPWAWICELAGGATEECTKAAEDGDTIMDQAQKLAERSSTVREDAWSILKERGIVSSAEAQQPGNNSCVSCQHDGDCRIQISRHKAQSWMREQLKSLA